MAFDLFTPSTWFNSNTIAPITVSARKIDPNSGLDITGLDNISAYRGDANGRPLGLFDQVTGFATGLIDGVDTTIRSIFGTPSQTQVGYDPTTGRPIYSGGAPNAQYPEQYPSIINPIMRLIPASWYPNGRNPYVDAANIANKPPPVSVFNKPIVGDITVGNAIVLGISGVLLFWGAKKLL